MASQMLWLWADQNESIDEERREIVGGFDKGEQPEEEGVGEGGEEGALKILEWLEDVEVAVKGRDLVEQGKMKKRKGLLFKYFGRMTRKLLEKRTKRGESEVLLLNFNIY